MELIAPVSQRRARLYSRGFMVSFTAKWSGSHLYRHYYRIGLRAKG